MENILENEFIRPIDNLGRVVIPAEIRKYYHWNAHDPIKMVFTKDGVLLTKSQNDDVENLFSKLSLQPEKARRLYDLLSTLDYIKKDF
ncbi:AbrB/MazE/SpoVT family DNA-binding domain-containing protein [Massiliimalia timonensis]|uniref:AbrB/MazE/SpoVT family DNA-binding domain-containing protein n=1 Tax=Massiliimalia timonensis TaxID=1987501 RepID=UPI00189C805D|nr:AbrB/MazE/SpoVT family DNA-binding domain-containing protein [Massiliimalia timonensis]